MASLKPKNPFYPLLVLVGLTFAFTACGFALMMVRGINAPGELEPDGGGGFMQFFQEHGFTAMMFELVVLALATCGAIATDEMWSDRADAAAPAVDSGAASGKDETASSPDPAERP